MINVGLLGALAVSLITNQAALSKIGIWRAYQPMIF